MYFINRTKRYFIICGLIFLLVIIISACKGRFNEDKMKIADALPQIFPDYTNITIPVNIAPLNFMVKEEETGAWLKIIAPSDSYKFRAKSGNFFFKESFWKDLLAENRGDTIFYELYLAYNEKTIRYKRFYQYISSDSIDSYLTYRLINVGYIIWKQMGIYQRNLENFDESPVIENTHLDNACINCHSFCKQNPEKMLLHTRKHHSGTTILNNYDFKKIETKTDYTLSSGVYPSWHPNGNIIAFSVNKIGQWFHSLSPNRITVSDEASDIILYNIEKNEVTTNPQISTPDRENLPVWSPDGKYLYYISAPRSIGRGTISVPEFVPYSLLRISYNEENNTWGKPDTLIRARDIGGSISFPKPSPDGKYLVFTKAKSGYFTINNNEADLNMLNLETSEIIEIPVNSDLTESYHSWCSSGRWMVISSKRNGGLFTRPYFTHFNKAGQFSKPFLLPQSDPEFYSGFVLNYNIPEFIIARISPGKDSWRRAIFQDAETVNFDKTVNVDALSGATAPK